jgi:Xaa-Pro dipeptidase
MSPSASDEIDLAACRLRQQRLLAVMQCMNLDLVIVNQIEHVQYLAGPRFRWVFTPAAALDREGRLTLVAPGAAPDVAAADRIVTYESQKHSTLRNDQRQAATAVLLAELPNRSSLRRIGVEFSSSDLHFTGRLDAQRVDIEPELYQLRRRKDSDELVSIRKAISGTAAMHARAREIVRPGVNELAVFNELQAAAVEAYGEMLTGTGNDYASGEMGGPPRDRKIEAGELYILDLGPAYRGYFADNTRTYAVGGKPTRDQLRAWEKVCGVFPLIEGMIRPGVRCQSVFEAADRYLREAEPWKFGHHLGHGIGLYPHEAPHLNPFWDDTFQAGEVIAVEPGLYAPELRAGLRLENNYLITETGVELLTPFPLEL